MWGFSGLGVWFEGLGLYNAWPQWLAARKSYGSDYSYCLEAYTRQGVISFYFVGFGLQVGPKGLASGLELPNTHIPLFTVAGALHRLSSRD